jgi:hypothetical protein
MNLSVAFKADRDCVLVGAWSLVGLLDYVIDFHLHTAEPVTDTARAMTGHQELLNVFILEFSHQPLTSVHPPDFPPATNRKPSKRM